MFNIHPGETFNILPVIVQLFFIIISIQPLG
jgi:phage shock protein PspC (stress-responsive transcriptional regulator)